MDEISSDSSLLIWFQKYINIIQIYRNSSVDRRSYLCSLYVYVVLSSREYSDQQLTPTAGIKFLGKLRTLLEFVYPSQ